MELLDIFLPQEVAQLIAINLFMAILGAQQLLLLQLIFLAQLGDLTELNKLDKMLFMIAKTKLLQGLLITRLIDSKA